MATAGSQHALSEAGAVVVWGNSDAYPDFACFAAHPVEYKTIYRFKHMMTTHKEKMKAFQDIIHRLG